MKTQMLLCLISGVVGAVVAIAATSRPQPAALAQDIGRRPQRGTPLGVPIPELRRPPVEDGYTPEERVNMAVYENVNRSVVNISTKGSAGTALFLFEIPSEGAGSGSVLDKSGHILTNYHVVEGAREIEVVLFDNKKYEARLVGRDPTNDVAVIRIDAPPDSLFPISFGDSTRLRVGQRVFALGNPFGLDRTLTTGIISSLNRTLPVSNSRLIKSIIQIDAAINPGNSGGPLLDTHGRVIGMNTAIASKTGQNTGVGFAIPANILARVVPQLIEKGKVVRPDIGIARVYQTDNGLLIATLVPGGPAERAGLRGFKVVRQQRRRGPFVYEYETVDRNSADLIVGVDGEKITTADEFLSLIEAKRPGDEVSVHVIREGRETLVAVRLAEGES
jgi:S1-C subfamily serine protease